MTARETKRDLVIAVALGCLIELGIWWATFQVDPDPSMAVPHPWLARLQGPGVSVAYFVAWHLVRPPRYPLSPYAGSACGFAVLIAMWSAAVFLMLRIGAVLRSKRS